MPVSLVITLDFSTIITVLLTFCQLEIPSICLKGVPMSYSRDALAYGNKLSHRARYENSYV